jgi:hypothetical protein
MKVSELLGEARDELYKGWTQGSYVNNAGHVCAVGAIERVAMRHQDIVAAAKAQAEINRLTAEIYGYNMVQSFNDRYNTSKQDVLNLFDKCIIGLEERGE